MSDLTGREALAVLFSVLKHAGSVLGTKEALGETWDVVECFSSLLDCFTTEQSTVKASLFVP